MTKTLTEQWRDGKLPEGYYYIRVKEQGKEKIIEHKISGSAFFYDQNVLLEIVAPVPSYDEYIKLKRDLDEYALTYLIGKDVNNLTQEENKKLQKQLEIATKTLNSICDITRITNSKTRTALREVNNLLIFLEGNKVVK